MPLWEDTQRLDRLKKLRNEVEIEIRRLERRLAHIAARSHRGRLHQNIGGATAAQVRAWALANGLDISDRGRIRREIRDQYLAAQNGATR